VVIHRLRTEIDNIPLKIQEMERDRVSACGTYDADLQKLEDLQKSCREKAAALADSQEAVKRRDEKLFKIKTQKEYQASITEVAEGRRLNKELEAEILQLMSQIERLQAEVTELKPGVEEKIEEVKKETGTLESSRQDLQKELELAQEARSAKLAGIEEKLITIYEEAKGHNPDAVAYIDRGACNGCHMSIRPQLVIEVLRQETLHICPNCQRILFPKEEAIEQQASGTES